MRIHENLDHLRRQAPVCALSVRLAAALAAAFGAASVGSLVAMPRAWAQCRRHCRGNRSALATGPARTIQYQVTLTDRKGNTNLVTYRMATATYDRPFTWKDWLLLPVYIIGYGFGIDSTAIDSYTQAFAQAEFAAYQDLENRLRSHLEERRIATGAHNRLTPVDEDPSAKVKVMIGGVMVPSTPIRRIAIDGVIRSEGERTTLEQHIEIGLWKNLSKIAPHEHWTLYEQREILYQ